MVTVRGEQAGGVQPERGVDAGVCLRVYPVRVLRPIFHSLPH